MINKKFLLGVVSSLFAFSFLALVAVAPSLVSADDSVGSGTGNCGLSTTLSDGMNIMVSSPYDPKTAIPPIPVSQDRVTAKSGIYMFSPIVEEWSGWAKVNAGGTDVPVAGPGSSIVINGQTFSPCTSCQNHGPMFGEFGVTIPTLSVPDGTDVTIKIFKNLPTDSSFVTTTDGVTSMALPEVDLSKGFYTVKKTFKYYSSGLQAPSVDPYILPNGIINQPYSQTLVAKCGSNVIFSNVRSGSFPAGFGIKNNTLYYDPSSVYVHPSAGDYVFTLVGDSGSQRVIQMFKIKIIGTNSGSGSSSGSGNSLGANNVSCPAGTVLIGMTNSVPPAPICSSSQNTGGSSGSNSGGYNQLTLSNGANSSVDLKAQPVKFENGKWTYQFIWTRGRDATGTFFVTPKSSPNTIVLKVDPASKTNVNNPATALLDPNTEYLAEYYNLPQCTKGDSDCVVIMSASFTTLAANAAPNGNGGSSSGSSSSSSQNNSGALASLQAQIDALTALIKQLADLLISKGINVSGFGNINGSSNNINTLYPCTNSSNCPPPTSVNTNGSRATYLDTNFVNVFKSNPGTGLAFPIEPQLVDTWGLSLKKDGNGKTYNAVSNLTEYQGYTGYGNTPPPADPTTGALVTNTSSSPCWNGTTDPKVTCDTTSRFAKGDYQEVWVYGTTGRPFSSSFWGPQCDSANVKIEKTLNIPSGITLDNRCQADSVSGRKIVLGTMSGSPSASGIFKNEFRVTTTKSDGTTTTGLTRVYFKIIDHGTMDVKLYPTEGNTGTATSTATLASRLDVSVEQTKNITTWTDIDFWAVPGSQDTSANPEIFANKILLGRYTVDEGYQGCNASTAGGVGAYKFGCAKWNWLVGSSLSSNLPVGEYTIYAVTHLPSIDKDGRYIARLYGNCQIGFTNTNGQGTSCNGFAWGGTHLKIDPALPGATLPNSPSNTAGTNNVASFSQLTIKAKRTVYKADGSTVVTESSIGASGTDNSGSTGCVAGNDSGGVTCAGPITTTDLKAGEKFDYEWQILVPNTKYIDVRYATSSTDCNVADVANSGGYWQGGEGKFCGDGSPIGGTVVRKGTPMPFTGTVNSSIVARGAVISTYLAPTDTQSSLVRRCTAEFLGIGFDHNPAQGFINSAQGGYGSSTAKFSSKVLSPTCAAALRNVSIDQTANVYIALNGGGNTYAGYRMGGLNFASSCVGVLDSYLCPLSYQPISNSEAWFNRPGTCNIPNTADIANRLGLGVGNYNIDAANALKKAGRNIDTSLLAQFTPFSGTSLSAGWAFDKAELTLSGTGYNKTFDLGNSQDPKWLKAVGTMITDSNIDKSVACYFSSLNCGTEQFVASPEFTGLQPASSYTLTAKFTCNGTNPAGGVNYREASVHAVTSSLNVGSNNPSSPSNPPPAPSEPNIANNVFSSINCYLPTTYQSDLNLSCRKTGSRVTTSFTLPTSWKFDNLRFYGDTQAKVQSGCNGGACSFENWNLKSSLPANGGLVNINIDNVPNTFNSTNPYWTRMIFDCSSSTTDKYASVGMQCN